MDQNLQKVNRVTVQGLILNIGLVILKLGAGLTSHSGAIIADAFHSLSDFSTDVALLWGMRAASRPADDDHQYGHGKIETMLCAGMGILLFAVAGAIFFEGAVKVVHVIRGVVITRPGWFAFLVALISVVTKEWMYRKTISVGRETGHQVLIANAWEHRSDALSSVGVMLGIFGAIVLGERWHVLDPVAAMVVSIFIARTAFLIVGQSFKELMDGALDAQQEQEILGLVHSINGASQAHKLRTRRVGQSVAIELHIRVRPDLNIKEAHDIATEVEDILKGRFGHGTFVSVHVEPLEK